MRELVSSIDTGFFWGLVLGVGLGAVMSWRFARLWERLREAIWQARASAKKSLEFYRFARDHITVLVASSGLGAAVVFGVGFLVYLRVTA